MPPLTSTEFATLCKSWPSRHFSPADLFGSTTARTNRIANRPNIDQFWNVAKFTAEILDPLQQQWDAHKLIISSGFRAPAVNALVGGSHTSDHLANSGAAADIDFPQGQLDRAQELYRLIWSMAERSIALSDHENAAFQFDQIILYESQCRVHIGRKSSTNRYETRRSVNGIYPRILISEIMTFPAHPIS